MARFTGGWFKAWRDFWVEDLSQNIFLWGLWNALLYMATYKETKIIWEGKPRVLPPGSVVFGIKELAEKWECSRTSIKRWLDYLVTSERILLETSHHGCIATIRDWEDFQTIDDDSRQPSGINVASTWHQRGINVALNEEVQERKKKEEENTYSPEEKKFSPEDLLEVWNENRGKLPRCRKLGEKRRKAALNALGSESNKDYWVTLIQALATSPWHNGSDINNTRGWVADFDFLLQKDKHLELYDRLVERKKEKQAAVPADAKKSDDELVAEILKRRAQHLGGAA